MKANGTPASPGSPSISELMTGLAQAALRDGLAEMTRAEGQRGKLVLTAELRLGDHGEPTSMVSSLYFERFRHNKDARE